MKNGSQSAKCTLRSISENDNYKYLLKTYSVKSCTLASKVLFFTPTFQLLNFFSGFFNPGSVFLDFVLNIIKTMKL